MKKENKFICQICNSTSKKKRIKFRNVCTNEVWEFESQQEAANFAGVSRQALEQAVNTSRVGLHGKILKPRKVKAFEATYANNDAFCPACHKFSIEIINRAKNQIKFKAGEKWAPVSGTDERYWVSNKGRLFRVKNGLNVEVKLTRSTLNYLGVALRFNGQVINTYLHRLVAEAFIPNPNGAATVNHKDFNRQNNNAENLEWVTYRENVMHSVEAGVHAKRLKGRIFCVNTGKIYDSVRVAARATGATACGVYANIAGYLLSTSGFRFELVR